MTVELSSITSNRPSNKVFLETFIMNSTMSHYSDSLTYDENFLAGIYCLFYARYKKARSYFLNAVYDHYPLEDHYHEYQSYLSLVDVLIDYQAGTLEHCYHSSDTDIPKVPEVKLNIACAEFLKGNRKQAFQALEGIDENEMDIDVYEELHTLYNIVGTRKKDRNGLLNREKLINKSFGKFFRKRSGFEPRDIEEFIIYTAKHRYKSVMTDINQLH